MVNDATWFGDVVERSKWTCVWVDIMCHADRCVWVDIMCHADRCVWTKRSMRTSVCGKRIPCERCVC
jgi:hypothetical protein